MPRATPYSGVAAIFRSRLENGRPPVVLEDGGQRRDFVQVRDVARASLLALGRVSGVAGGPAPGLAAGPVSGPASGLTPGLAAGLAGGGLRCCNVASGEPHTVGEMAFALAGAFGAIEPVVTGEYRSGDVRDVVASPAGATAYLGFRGPFGFGAGMAEFARAPLREPAMARA